MSNIAYQTMVEAILHGEYHTSASDRKSLDDQIENDVDAIFVEQREERYEPDEWTLGYLLFLSGAFSVFWLQSKLQRIKGSEITNQYDIDVHDKIDTDLPELYSRFPSRWRIGAGAFSFLLFAYAVYTPFYPIPFVEIPSHSINGFELREVAISLYNVIVRTFVLALIPLLYSAILVIFEVRYIGSRDSDMAENISRITEQNGYEKIVVSCGNAHVKGISEELEENGIDTTSIDN